MTDWHCCMPGHAWGDDGVCLRCGAYEPEKRIKKVEYATPQELSGFALRMVVERIAFRIDVMNERGLEGVSISKGFAQEIVNACRRGAELLENPEPAQAGLIVGGGSGNANVSEGVTGGGERAVGDAAGETCGHMAEPKVDDPAAETLCDDCPPVGYPTDKTRCLPCPRRLPAAIAGPSLLRPAGKPYDYRCDCCDNGLNAEWDFCPYCGKIQREEPSGLCLAGLATNTACRPDNTLRRCTICGFVVDAQYAAERPTMHLRTTKRS